MTDITYVDHDPLIPGRVHGEHVHVRSSDRCLKNTTGVPCQTPEEMRAELAVLRAAMPGFSALYGGHRAALTPEAQRACHAALTYPRSTP